MTRHQILELLFLFFIHHEHDTDTKPFNKMPSHLFLVFPLIINKLKQALFAIICFLEKHCYAIFII